MILSYLFGVAFVVLSIISLCLYYRFGTLEHQLTISTNENRLLQKALRVSNGKTDDVITALNSAIAQGEELAEVVACCIKVLKAGKE